MSTFWTARTPGERRMIVIMVVIVLIAVPFMLVPPGGGSTKLLPPDKARRETKMAEADLKRMESESLRLQPETAKRIYDNAPEAAIPIVIKQLQESAKRSGIHIREIKPLRIRGQAGMMRVPLTVRFSSDFGRVVPFFYDLEDPAGKLVIDKFNVSAPQSASRSVDVEAQVSFFTRSAAAGEPGADTRS